MRHRSAPLRNRHGAALLEALVALTILATAGASLVAFATDASRALAHARETEAEVKRASALLDAVALWPREDLDRHLGDRPQGDWRLLIERPTPTLYTVQLLDSTRRRELLRTTLYRRQPLTRLTDASR